MAMRKLPAASASNTTPLLLSAAAAGPADGVCCKTAVSPAAKLTVLTVSLQLVAAPAIVHVIAVGAPFLRTVKVRLSPAPGAVGKSTYKLLNVPPVGNTVSMLNSVSEVQRP